jgi:hypothetical protein
MSNRLRRYRRNLLRRMGALPSRRARGAEPYQVRERALWPSVRVALRKVFEAAAKERDQER